MKANELVEKVDFKIPSPYAPEREVLVFKNPSSMEYRNLLAKTLYGEVRGITNGNVVYVWDANLATHTDILQYIENKVDIGKFIASVETIYSADEVKDDLFFNNHKMIKRMFG